MITPMQWTLVITGCGTSHGNPPWGRPQLWSQDPRDLRRRSGAQLHGPDGEVILIDTGPDLLHQLRDPFVDWDGSTYPQRCVTRCDGVLLTHVHADHAHGINELRHLNRLMKGRSIGLHGAHEHLDELATMFPYCFTGGDAVVAPALQLVPVNDHQPFTVAGVPLISFAMEHGPAGRVSGFRIGGLAYCTDCKTIPAASRAALRGVPLLVLGMLREQVHPTHMNWHEAAALIDEVQPQRTVLVHMGHEVRYGEWCDRLPAGVEMAYDGWHAPFTV
jgi:phosphoribosyl 1,2-cyclic phosphate phosphodiesterase